jgi:hypothetical protein
MKTMPVYVQPWVARLMADEAQAALCLDTKR